jgi:RNA polymerase subunit RPABC4/transcription elongation factor Spt4
MGICRHCGSPIVLRGAKFCPECGQPLATAADDGAKRNSRGKCAYCGHQPLEQDAAVCPSCGATAPVPRAVPRFLTDGAVTGFVVGGGAGVMLVVAFSSNPNWFVTLFCLVIGGMLGAARSSTDE